MRVLHFAGNYFPVPGGASIRVHNMLASPENEHIVVVPYPDPARCPEETEEIPETETRGHLEIRRVHPDQGPLAKVPIVRDRLKAKALTDQVADDEFDILHGHNPMACALAAQRIKRQTHVPMVYEAHGIMRDTAFDQRVFGPLTALNRATWAAARSMTTRVERRVLKKADRVIAQTDSTRRRLRSLFPLNDKPIDVIRNGVDVNAFDPGRFMEDRRELRARHGWQDRLVCLYAGYLDTVNGIDFLLRALRSIGGDLRRKLRIVLLGQGPRRRQIEAAAREHGDLLEFGGMVPHHRMPAYYAACDVFTIPRPSTLLAEMLLPMKLLEAMSMARVLLVSDVAAMKEVVSDGRNGLTFAKGDQADFVGKLQHIASHGGDFARLGDQARSDTQRHYTWIASRRKLQAIYDDLAGRLRP